MQHAVDRAEETIAARCRWFYRSARYGHPFSYWQRPAEGGAAATTSDTTWSGSTVNSADRKNGRATDVRETAICLRGKKTTSRHPLFRPLLIERHRLSGCIIIGLNTRNTVARYGAARPSPNDAPSTGDATPTRIAPQNNTRVYYSPEPTVLHSAASSRAYPTCPPPMNENYYQILIDLIRER